MLRKSYRCVTRVLLRDCMQRDVSTHTHARKLRHTHVHTHVHTLTQTHTHSPCM
jgi:hypothetical protein